MSALATRLWQLTMIVNQKLPSLLLPESDDERAMKQESELSELRDQLLRLLTELRTCDYMLRAAGRNKLKDPWAQKQRLADVKRENEEAGGLVQRIEDVLRCKGLNPMKAGKEIQELLENLHLPAEQLNQVREMLLHPRQNTQSIESPNAIHADPLKSGDVASQMVVIACVMLSWVIKKQSDAKKKSRAA